MKPGIMTTEFWVGVVVLVLCGIGAVWEGAAWAKFAAYIGAGLTAAGYALSRGLAKGAAVALLSGSLLVLPSCGGLSLQEEYVKADRETFEFVAPDYMVYVAADQSLDPTQREAKQLVVDSWRMRLERAEENVQR